MATSANATRSLQQKRILITDIENEFGKELFLALKGEGAAVFTFVKECPQIQQVIKNHPEVIPVLLDIAGKDGDEAYKLLMSFPALDHIINLSGDIALDVISKAYGQWKIQDFGENKTKPLISKMKDAGGRGLIFHSSAGNQNLMSKLKANLNPRYTDSATAQVSTSVRKSFKRLFSNSSEPVQKPTPVASNLAQTIEQSNIRAMDFAAAATSLSQTTTGVNKHQSGPQVSNSSEGQSQQASNPRPPKRSLSLSLKFRNSTRSASGDSPKVRTANEKNEKVRQSVSKINTKVQKKWNKLIKRIEKEQLSQLKSLDKELNVMKKREKISLMSQNAEANANTMSRAGILSAETTSKIVASREARVDKEVDKKVDKKRDQDTQKIAEVKQARIEASTEKLYHKMVAKQMAEFYKIRSKYMI